MEVNDMNVVELIYTLQKDSEIIEEQMKMNDEEKRKHFLEGYKNCLNVIIENLKLEKR